MEDLISATYVIEQNYPCSFLAEDLC